MPRLILMRHALPHIDTNIPANQWALSEEGRQRTLAIAPRIADYKPQAIITSTEAKAIQTGQIIAQALDLDCNSAANLHEHDRSNEHFETSRAAFEQRVRAFFSQPDQLVFGTETGTQACTRFSNAVQNVLELYPGKTLVIVTHGTVMTLFTANHNPINRFDFWKQLQQPDFKVYTLPDFKLEHG